MVKGQAIFDLAETLGTAPLLERLDLRNNPALTHRKYVACVQNKLSSFYQTVEERELSLEGKEIMRKNILEGRAQLIALYWESTRRKNATEAQQHPKNDNLMAFYEYNDEEPLSFVRLSILRENKR